MGDDRRTRDAHGLASAVHELRTPLVTIRGFLETLRDRDDQLAPEVRSHVIQVAHRNAVLLGERIETLLRYEQLAEDPTIAAHPQRVREVVSRIAEDCSGILVDHHLRQDVPGELSADIDGEAMTHVLANLLGNAARHSPRESSITVRARPDGATVRVEVVDAGSGISPEDLPHVFEPWYRGEAPARGGSGLGLALVRRYVQAWGGTVAIESTPGRGTTVGFTLPRTPVPVTMLLPEPSVR